MISPIEIRRVRPEECEQLGAISIATFVDTYEEHNTPENMASYIEKSFNDDRLLAELKSKDTHYYFAQRDDDILGYLRLNFGTTQTNQSLEKSCEIERIYVAQDFHGLNIGKLLFETAVEAAQIANLTWLWLGVWDQNKNAIGFYDKMGFGVFRLS